MHTVNVNIRLLYILGGRKEVGCLFVSSPCFSHTGFSLERGGRVALCNYFILISWLGR